MKAIKIIALAALIALLASCGNGQPADENQNDLTSKTENEQIASPLTDIYGTYQGVIPAANTAGIAMYLTINSDETFILTREYQDKKQGSFKDHLPHAINSKRFNP
jgi:uncharacterized lipoprotein NlpE involved in copper resistance